MAIDEFDWDKWIFKRGWQWYHLDETENECGPYESKAEALSKLQDYCFWLENGLTRYAAQMAHGV